MDKSCEKKPNLDKVCFNNFEEIKILRTRVHDYGDKITTVQAITDGNSDGITRVKKDLENLKEKHITKLETSVARLDENVSNISDKIKSMDHKFWAILVIVITTLIGVITT